MSKKHRRSVAPLFAMLIVLASLVMPAIAQAGNSSSVLPPQSGAFGQSYSALSAAWWEWAFAIPVHDPQCRQVGQKYKDCNNPIDHPAFINNLSDNVLNQDFSGLKCAVGQSGSMWFLGGAFAVIGQPFSATVARDCRVPVGTALFFPIVNGECSFLEGAAYGCPGDTADMLRADVAPLMDAFKAQHGGLLEADLDGAAIPISESDRAASPTFGFQLPEDNLLSAIGEGPYSAGNYYPSVADGYYLMLAPLSVGNHTLHFRAIAPDLPFDLAVTYYLTVAP